MKIEIRNSAGTPCFRDVVRRGSKRKFTLMKEDFILLKFSLKSPVFFKLGDWTEDTRFGRFELCDLYKPKYNRKTGAYDYELQLDAYYWKWKTKSSNIPRRRPDRRRPGT